jgi:benzylsuccinate CoA-transferase BbsF subunit
MRYALEGVRVLDFCWVGAGALVTKVLAEHGADVIKVESRARPDNLRLSPPFRSGREGLDGSGYFASRNNDKRSLALNMRTDRGRELARRLARSCDLVTSNFRPGVMERWGLGYGELAEENPGLVYVEMPMQGADGPHRDFVGFGSTIAALAGLVELSGLPDRAPVGTGTHYPNHVPSPGHALVAVLAALHHRQRTGEGCRIEVSQLESAVTLIAPALAAASVGEPEPPRAGNRVPHQSPSAVLRCRGDDEWIAVAARDDAEWRALAEELGGAALAAERRFATLTDRKRNEDELEATLAPLCASRDRHELAAALQRRGVPAAAVLASDDLLADAQLAARGFWRRVEHPVMGELSSPAAPFVADGARTGPTRAAPLLGEHTREIASSLLGLGDEEIEELEAAEVLW